MSNVTVKRFSKITVKFVSLPTTCVQIHIAETLAQTTKVHTSYLHNTAANIQPVIFYYL